MLKYIGSVVANVGSLLASYVNPMTFLPMDLGVLGSGTNKLMSDISTWLIASVGILGAIALAYYGVRKYFANETDAQMYNKRMTGVIIVAVIATLGKVIIEVVLSYYQ